MEYEPPDSTRRAVPYPGAVHSGIPERQMVQVIRQAPQTAARQVPGTAAPQAPGSAPRQAFGTAAQYLQQMYAAQQQHLLLQTTVLQQQATRIPPAVSASQPTPSQPLMISFSCFSQIVQHPIATILMGRSAIFMGRSVILDGPFAILGCVSAIFGGRSAILGGRSAILPGPSAILGVFLRHPLGSLRHPWRWLLSSLAVPPPSSGIAPSFLGIAVPSSRVAPLSLGVAPPSSRVATLAVFLLIFTPVASMSRVQAAVSPGATSQVQNLTLRGENIGQSQPPGSPAIGLPEIVTSGDQETASKTPEPVTVQPPNTLALFSLLSGAQKVLQSPPRPLLPLTQVPQCLGSTPVTSAAPCATSNGPREGPGASWSPAGTEVSVQHQLLGSSAAVLQIPAASGASPPAAETPYKPSLKGCSPVPAAVSIPRTLDQSPAHDSTPLGSPDFRLPLDMTSGNGSSPIPAAATGNAPQNGESKPPQAAVRPQILTHVIEGFVIQEGGQPFPSHRSRAVREVGPHEKPPTEKQPKQHEPNMTTDSEMEETFTTVSKDELIPPKLKCELCGRVDFEYKFKRSKRFCSMACAKRYNVGCTKRVGLFHPDRSKLQKPVVAKPQRRRSRKRNLQSPSEERMMLMSETITPISVTPLTTISNLNHNNSQEDSSRCSDHSSYEEPLSPMSAISSLSRRRHFERGLELTGLQGGLHSFLPRDPTKWNVEDVYEFIRSLPGCQEISEEFRVQEIDGQALLLLKEDHLMSTMNIKLGPALKLFARISMLKDS